MQKMKRPVRGYLYILECANGTYYIGSTRNLFKRVAAHQNGIGANYTKKHLPVCLVYFEEFDKIWKAFYREKQIQRWTSHKKSALVNGEFKKLKELAACKNETSHLNVSFDFAQETNSPVTERSRSDGDIT
jgi:putative endonuclease